MQLTFGKLLDRCGLTDLHRAFLDEEDNMEMIKESRKYLRLIPESEAKKEESDGNDKDKNSKDEGPNDDLNQTKDL